MSNSLEAVIAAVDEMDIDGIEGHVQKCLAENIPPMEVIEQGISKGLDIVGQKFEEGEYFLADLVMAGEVVKTGMKLLESQMDPSETGKKGKIIVATVQGDIHEIGKNILAMLLSASGYEVIDLGVDVSAQKIIDTVKQTGSSLIGLSVLLTTMVNAIKEVVDGLTEAGLRESVKVAIGGACCSQNLADEMGADAYGESAVEAVRIFEELGAA